MKELKLFKCELCGNLICMLEDSGVVPVCCGREMTLEIANTEDAAVEKHVPVMRREENTVRILVGKMPHPMTPQHQICHIFLLTDKGLYIRQLEPENASAAVFHIGSDESVAAVYAWCNLHGLWKR